MAVTVAVVPLLWITLAEVGLTESVYTNAGFTVSVNAVDRVLTSSALPLIVTV